MNKVKPLTLKELELKEEMKARCLTKGQYTDEKAKDKFYMLCHLEDYEVQYYDLLNIIEELRSWLEKNLASDNYTDGMYYGFKICLSKLNELEGKDENNNIRL